jgi:hypothetical protein
MRYVFLVLLMSAVMVGLITWATRPDLVEMQYDRVAAPIEKHFAEKRAAAWQVAKEQAWHKWMSRVHLPSECKNALQVQASSFERDWKSKIASGWIPEGVD